MKRFFILATNIAFVAAVAIIFVSGFAKTLFFPKDINTYENRKANKIPSLTVPSFVGTDFQDGMENALLDQVQFSELFKKGYNKIETAASAPFLKKIYESNPDKCFTYNGLLTLGGDSLLYYPRQLDESAKGLLATKAESINNLTEKYNNLDFYLYYIEKDTDIDFQTNNKIGFFEFIKNSIAEERCKISRFEINSFNEFSMNFYKTDHHWNHIGSYKSYNQLIDLLEITEEPLPKGEEFVVNSRFSGSKAMTTKSYGVWTEVLRAYKFEFPKMLISLNGTSAEDYGNQNKIGDGNYAYAGYYGADNGEIIFDMDKPDKDNILVIGESYDNAILKLLATHYNKTFSIDLRYYEHIFGGEFNFAEYVEKNKINKVLFIGNIDFYLMQEFTVR